MLFFLISFIIIASLYFFFSIGIGFCAFFYSFIIRLFLMWPYYFYPVSPSLSSAFINFSLYLIGHSIVIFLFFYFFFFF